MPQKVVLFQSRLNSTALGPDVSLDVSYFLWLWSTSIDPQCADKCDDAVDRGLKMRERENNVDSTSEDDSLA